VQYLPKYLHLATDTLLQYDANRHIIIADY
jgi:hypothetical protein